MMEELDPYPQLLIPPSAYRPTLMARSYMVSSGHYLATAAAFKILQNDGNAIDAGVAGGLLLNIVHADMTNLGGVAPIIIYDAGSREVSTISGLGWWSEEAALEKVLQRSKGVLRGVMRGVVPGAADAWLTALERFGTMSFAEVAAPAIELCENGFPLYPYFKGSLEAGFREIRTWPGSAAIYLRDGKVPLVGTLIVQHEYGRTLRLMAEAEAAAIHNGRAAGIRAARDCFYHGPIAEAMVRFYRAEGGFLTLRDLADFHVEVQPSVAVSYRGHEVHACGPWCQGPVVLQTLKILEGYDLAALPHNSPEHIHLVTEALKAGFADRHAYYGDPHFVSVPLSGLLHDDYAAKWRQRIRLDRATSEMPEPGDPWSFAVEEHQGAIPPRYPPTGYPVRPIAGSDTSYICVIDAYGNGFSATPSDGIQDNPVVPDLGIIVSGRGNQSYFDPDHPNCIAPRKRPRLTPSPGLVLKDGRLWMVYGTPGGDVQPQAMTQLLINLIDYKMELQPAIEAPRIASSSFPHSDYPHSYYPGRLRAESRIALPTITRLSDLGHRMYVWRDLVPAAGGLCAVIVDPVTRVLRGGADPRRVSYALGW